ncbi:MAG: hypothetical protein ACE5FO_03340 [Parvularculaceae bacterium]
MTQSDADLARRITAHLPYWQGLRFVPFGLALIVFAAKMGEWTDFPGPMLDQVVPVAGGTAFIVYLLLAGYYRRTFGSVSYSRTTRRSRTIVEILIAAPLMLGSIALDLLTPLPVFLSGAAWGLSILIFWAATGRGRGYYLFGAFVVAAMTFAPLVNPEWSARVLIPPLFAAFGLTFVIGGVLDHLTFRRVMQGDGRAA